jgi:hypothetical protein
MYAGRCFGGADKAMMVNAPEEMPAPPTPVIARPMISARLLGATPNSKNVRNSTSGVHDEWKLTADQTSDFENENGDQERYLQWEVLVCLSPCSLKAPQSYKERGAIPSLVLDSAEFIRNLWNRRCDNCLW